MMDVAEIVAKLRDFIDHMSVVPEYGEETRNLIEAAAALETIQRERDEAREALRPFAQVLVYSFEDDPGKIHVTYAGETLTVLELDSGKGSAALKLEQDIAKARATLTHGGR